MLESARLSHFPLGRVVGRRLHGPDMRTPPLPWALLLAGLLATSALAQKSSSAFFPYAIKSDRLDNGLVVSRVQYPSNGLVAYYAVVRVGSRNEIEPGRTGFAHFFEHMMFRGTKRFPPGAREKLLASLGYNDNAYTTDDMTVYHSFGPTRGLTQLIEVEADRFQHLEYAEEAFKTEAQAVLGEYNKSAAQPGLRMEEKLLSTAFTVHPYRHTTLGYLEDIQGMPGLYDYSKTFFERWYTPDNLLLFVVGDFDDAALMKAVREQYGSWKKKAPKVEIPREPPQEEPRSVEVSWESPTLPRLKHAWHTPAARLEDQNAAIQNILGPYLVGPTSPLYKELVLERQQAERIGSDYYDHRDPSLFSLEAVTRSVEARPEVGKAFDAAVAELRQGKLDAARVKAIQSHLRYGLLMELRTADEVANSLAFYAGIYGVPDALPRHFENLAKVKPESLVRFAKQHLVDTNRTVLTLTSTAPAQKEGGK